MQCCRSRAREKASLAYPATMTLPPHMDLALRTKGRAVMGKCCAATERRLAVTSDRDTRTADIPIGCPTISSYCARRVGGESGRWTASSKMCLTGSRGTRISTANFIFDRVKVQG